VSIDRFSRVLLFSFAFLLPPSCKNLNLFSEVSSFALVCRACVSLSCRDRLARQRTACIVGVSIMRPSRLAGGALAAASLLLSAPTAAAAAAAAATAATPQPAYPYPGFTPAGGWVATLNEDFDGPSLNTSLWAPRVNETHCEPCELQLYVPQALALSDSALVITTDHAHLVGPGGQVFNFSSGWVDTQGRFAQQYGLFEARARLPPPNATGVWPAFWLLPNSSQCWPLGGEVDVFEFTAMPLASGSVFGSYRWGTACGSNRQPLPGAAYPPLGAPAVDFTAYHVYAVTWNASAITFFVDGNAYETVTAAAAVLPTSAMYVILNTAVAWYWPPSAEDPGYPTTTAFDYVRVYEWAPA
jgi:beta-glucanase (GH16 family)